MSDMIDYMRDDPRFDQAWWDEFARIEDYRFRSKECVQINADLARTKKAVVSLGCSFTQGQSSYDLDMVAKCPPRHTEQFSGYDYRAKGHTQQELLDIAYEKFLRVYMGKWMGAGPDWCMDTTPMELDNAYVNEICRKLDNKWTPINLGHNGNGDMAAIMRLFMYEIDWDICEEVIFVWTHSDPHRYNMINEHGCDDKYVLGDFYTVWPWLEEPTESQKDDDNYLFNHYYAKRAWSERMISTNFLTYSGILQRFIKSLNAKANLVVFPAFEKLDRREMLENCSIGNEDFGNHLIKNFPWSKQITIDDTETFFHLAMSHEPGYQRNMNMHQLYGCDIETDYPNGWIYPCAHPSKKGHDLLADELIKYFTKEGWL